MPFSYCNHCKAEIDDYNEAYKGCKQCGTEQINFKDFLIYKIEDIEDRISALESTSISIKSS